MKHWNRRNLPLTPEIVVVSQQNRLYYRRKLHWKKEDNARGGWIYSAAEREDASRAKKGMDSTFQGSCYTILRVFPGPSEGYAILRIENCKPLQIKGCNKEIYGKLTDVGHGDDWLLEHWRRSDRQFASLTIVKPRWIEWKRLTTTSVLPCRLTWSAFWTG